MKPHNKRFMVIFSIWGKAVKKFGLEEFHHSETEFDTEKEWKEEVALLKEFYEDTPKPVVSSNGRTLCPTGEEKFWGYMVLDFQKEKVLEIGEDGIFDYQKANHKNNPSLQLLDRLFRRDDEIPVNYRFDSGEYLGWLQFRWGDGKNKINESSKSYREI